MDDRNTIFLLGWPIFRCDLFDLGSVTILSQVKLARKIKAANAPASKVLAVDSGETHLLWIFRSLQARWAQKNINKNQLHLYRWINPRVKPMWIRPFCWGFHITSLFIPIDRVEPMVWMDSGGSPFRVARGLDGTQSFGMDCENQQKSNEEKLIQESGSNVINYIWHLICILYRTPPPKKKSQFFVDHHLCFVVVGCRPGWFIWEDHRWSPKVSLVSLGGVKLNVRPRSSHKSSAEIMASNRMRCVGFSNGKHVTVVPFVGDK